MRYWSHGLTVECDLSLALPLAERRTHSSVRVEIDHVPGPSGTTVLEQHFSTGDVHRIERIVGGYRLVFSDVNFRAVGQCVGVFGGTPDVISRLLANQVLPRGAFLRGGLGLHASAVSMQERAWVFVGPARAGKSTLALALAQRPGVHLLADDSLTLVPDGERTLVHGSGLRSRVHSDVRDYLRVEGEPAGPKWATGPFGVAATTRLAGIFVLACASTAGVGPLRPGEAFAPVVRSVLRIDPRNAAYWAHEHDILTRVLAQVPARAVTRTAQLSDLSEVEEMVFREIARSWT